MRMLFLDDRESDLPVYRTFSLNRAVELVQEKRLTLVRPIRWDDPFENVLLRRHLASGGEGGGPGDWWEGGKLFGSCWTTLPETDFGWRVYAPNKDGVIVATTVSKITTSFPDYSHYFMANCFIGRVQYHSGERIKEIVSSEAFQSSNRSSDTAHMRATGLLLKRPEFTHESEVRVIVEPWPDDPVREDEFIDLPLEPNEFVTDVVLDPRFSAKQAANAEFRLRDAGYSGPVRRSLLYRDPWEE